MKLTRGFRFQPGFLYLAPVLDVAFLLGLFLVLSTSFLLQPGIAVQSPHSPFLLAPQRNPVVISVTGAPRLAVYFRNQEIELSRLAEELDDLALPATIVIKADRHAPVEWILEITNLALAREIPVVWATDPNLPNLSNDPVLPGAVSLPDATTP